MVFEREQHLLRVPFMRNVEQSEIGDTGKKGRVLMLVQIERIYALQDGSSD